MHAVRFKAAIGFFIFGLCVGVSMPVRAVRAAVKVPDLRGRILLQTESHGEAWYVRPETNKRYYLKDGASAYAALRLFGAGISNADIAKIAVGIEPRISPPNGIVGGTGFLATSRTLTDRMKGHILLQVESHGEAWYVNPVDGKRYYMKDGEAAYQLMRFQSLGITNANLTSVVQGDFLDDTSTDCGGDFSCFSKTIHAQSAVRMEKTFSMPLLGLYFSATTAYYAHPFDLAGNTYHYSFTALVKDLKVDMSNEMKLQLLADGKHTEAEIEQMEKDAQEKVKKYIGTKQTCRFDDLDRGLRYTEQVTTLLSGPVSSDLFSGARAIPLTDDISTFGVCEDTAMGGL